MKKIQEQKNDDFNMNLAAELKGKTVNLYVDPANKEMIGQAKIEKAVVIMGGSFVIIEFKMCEGNTPGRFHSEQILKNKMCKTVKFYYNNDKGQGYFLNADNNSNGRYYNKNLGALLDKKLAEVKAKSNKPADFVNSSQPTGTQQAIAERRKPIRLKESDLVNIVKKVIIESKKGKN
jgi:hypothetical protein